MEQHQTPKTTQQRRRLLKSALAASSVAGMGYSGSALASVTKCISNQKVAVPTQFYVGANPPPSTGANWTWKSVTVNQYRVNNATTGTRIPGFQLATGVFRAASPWDKIVDGTGNPQNQNSFTPYTAWVVVYFDSETKSEKGAFPEYKAPLGGVAQASLNCLGSLDPNLAGSGTYKFGG